MKLTLKKIVALSLMLAMLALTAFACTGGTTPAAAGSTDLLANVIAKGKLVAAIEVGSEPFTFADPATGEYIGFNIDIMNGFCESIGVKLELAPMEFSELFEAVNNGKADMASANISRTAKRSATVLFTEPVTHSNGIAMVLKSSGLTSIDELNDPSRTVCGPSGGVYVEIARELWPNAKVEEIGSSADAIAALQAGRVDAYLTDTNTSSVMMKDDDTLTILPEPLSVDTVAFGLKMDLGSYTLRDAFNNYLKIIKMDGTYSDICEKWYGAPWTPFMGEYGA